MTDESIRRFRTFNSAGGCRDPFWHHAMVSSIPLLMPNEDKEGHFKVNKQILSHKNLRTTQMVAGSILLWL